MATVYKIELVSHWMNFSEDVIQKRIEMAMSLPTDHNEVQVTVKRQ